MSFVDQYEVKNLGNLELLARQVVEGFIVGLHKSPFHGFSVEFAEHRLYNPGESTKNIDWKVYARTDKLFTKKFEEETNLRCHIIIDVSSSMYYPEKNPKAPEKLNKLEFSALAAASLMNLLKRQRDAFGLSLFNEDIIFTSSDKSSSTHYKLLVSQLDQLISQPLKNKKTSLALAVHQIAELIHKRSMVVMFSDMLVGAAKQDEMFEALRHLKHNKHEVVLFQVLDNTHELNFEFDNKPYIFVDMETGEELRLHASQIREHYAGQMKQYLDRLRSKCLEFKIDLIEADISQGFKKILEAYLVKRSKMTK